MHTKEAIYMLSDLRPGEQAVVIGRGDPSAIVRRLGDFGIGDGTPVMCECVGFLGDPTAYRFGSWGSEGVSRRVSGTVIAVRKQDAACIRISEPHRKTQPEGGGEAWA